MYCVCICELMYKSKHALWNGTIPHILAVKKIITLFKTEFDGLTAKMPVNDFFHDTKDIYLKIQYFF